MIQARNFLLKITLVINVTKFKVNKKNPLCFAHVVFESFDSHFRNLQIYNLRNNVKKRTILISS